MRSILMLTILTLAACGMPERRSRPDLGPVIIDELCDGIDNDGDGMVDEGYNDSDRDGIKDCVDVDEETDGGFEEVDAGEEETDGGANPDPTVVEFPTPDTFFIRFQLLGKGSSEFLVPYPYTNRDGETTMPPSMPVNAINPALGFYSPEDGDYPFEVRNCTDADVTVTARMSASYPGDAHHFLGLEGQEIEVPAGKIVTVGFLHVETLGDIIRVSLTEGNHEGDVLPDAECEATPTP